MKTKVIELTVDGMNCNHCASSLNRFLEKKGFEDVYVNYSTSEVRYKASNPEVSLEEVKEGIAKMGYVVVDENTEQPWWTLERKLLISAIFTLPLLLGHVFMMLGINWFAFLDNYWIQFALCLPVFIIGWMHFGKSAWSSVKSGVPNMDVLIFVGSTAAFIYSLIGTVMNESNYIFYETTATIITLVLLGNFFEKRSVAQTTSAIEELSQLKVAKARKLMRSGAVVKLDVKDIQVNDIILVNEGDHIPLDGEIVSGHATIDESMLSGESIPIDKKEGNPVFGSSVLKSGNIRIKVTATGKDTMLEKMIQLVKDAQQEKPDIQRLADQISAVFVPAVLGIALLTLLISYFVFNVPFSQALMNSIAVLVISCPCAMGLATPTAVMVGVGRVAKNGILIRGGQTLEQFADVKNIVFDKTGTLTTGDFKIKKINYHTDKEEDVNAMIYALEQYSSHPIAVSILKEMGKKTGIYLYDLLDIKELKGLGVQAKDNFGNQLKIGSYTLAKEITDDSQHSVYLLRNDKLLATIDLEDELKPDAKATIDYLKKKNIKTYLLSGDRKEKVEEVAKKLGITEVLSEHSPEEKLKVISKLTEQAATAMVGDGINDAPALAKATVGVSLSNASQVAIQSAQVVLLNGKLGHLTKAISISKATLKTIKQSLFWAFAYNIVAIPIAALGFLNPMLGALFMAFSDIVVIGNSLRLRNRKLD